jgi:hypothetical protein
VRLNASDEQSASRRVVVHTTKICRSTKKIKNKNKNKKSAEQSASRRVVVRTTKICRRRTKK